MLIEHPEEKETSPMWRLPTYCDGQVTGKMCKHYWNVISRMEVMNPGVMKKGREDRFCILNGGLYPMMDGGAELAVYCSHYEASEREYLDSTKIILSGADKKDPEEQK